MVDLSAKCAHLMEIFPHLSAEVIYSFVGEHPLEPLDNLVVMLLDYNPSRENKTNTTNVNITQPQTSPSTPPNSNTSNSHNNNNNTKKIISATSENPRAKITNQVLADLHHERIKRRKLDNAIVISDDEDEDDYVYIEDNTIINDNNNVTDLTFGTNLINNNNNNYTNTSTRTNTNIKNNTNTNTNNNININNNNNNSNGGSIINNNNNNNTKQHNHVLRNPDSRKNKLADLYENKSKNKSSSSHNININVNNNNNNNISSAKQTVQQKTIQSQKQQLEQIRKEKQREYRSVRGNMMTLSDLDNREILRQKSKAGIWDSTSEENKNQNNRNGMVHTIDSTFMSPDRIGKEALQYTNDFRKKNKLPPLMWSQALTDIAKEHSKNMGDGRVPFGHDGFNDRVRKYPFFHNMAAENVAMNGGTSEVAKTAVDGWINSPGHRKNLLSNSNLCGIGVYENGRGMWYLTQLFANAPQMM